ncbi:MAG: GGDEF domain-containing protein [Clostridiales bacterium]|nr:GGDEF domain-containing protein [Clostridiales bacterium]
MLQEISVIDDGNFKFVYELEKEINFNKEHIRISKNKSSEMEEVLKNIPSLILIHEERLEEKTEKIINMIQNDDNNSITPIIVISPNLSKKRKVDLIKMGVQYYIRSPYDIKYIHYVIKNLLRLLYVNRRISPLTGLPGNVQIQSEIKRRLLKKKIFAILYLDLDNFKSYNDIYGFSNGDKIIEFTSKIITKNILSKSQEIKSFVGHIGGDDFVAIIDKTEYKDICEKIVNEFDNNVLEFFTKEDRERGYLKVLNRKGIIEKFPLTSISIGVVEIKPENIKNILEIGELRSSS